MCKVYKSYCVYKYESVAADDAQPERRVRGLQSADYAGILYKEKRSVIGMRGAFKWCFIGAGKLADKVAGQVIASGRHELVSVYTRSHEKGRRFAAKHGCAAYDDAKAAMTAGGVQAVYVVTPHSSHYEYVKLAIELGVPVLCEKPFTTDAGQAEELFALARERGVYVAEAMWTWFSPIANQVKGWLDHGEFGEIERVKASYRVPLTMLGGRLTDPGRAGGALLDIGVYPLTYLYRLFGNPTKVVCRGVVENGIDLEEEVDLTFADGKTCVASISMRELIPNERLTITGSRASVDLKRFHGANEVKLCRKDGGDEAFSGDGSILNEFDLASQEILAGKTQSSYVPPKATVDVMRIMDECRKQMELVYPFERG